MCLCLVAVVHTLPEGRAVVGVTSLGEEIYLLRDKDTHQVKVYDFMRYHLQRCLTVSNARRAPDTFSDMTSCEHLLCLYISNLNDDCIHRLDLHGYAQQWPVNDRPTSLSVNANHNLIVTFCAVSKIKEFSPHGELVRDVILHGDVIYPQHAIQLTSGQFIVCHGRGNDPVHRVCKVSSDGHHIVQSHGGQPGSDTGQYNGPWHLAVDDNEFVFVVDAINRRVTLLSPTLEYVRQVVSRDQLEWEPRRLCSDVHRGRVYVADSDECEVVGRAVVFTVYSV